MFYMIAVALHFSNNFLVLVDPFGFSVSIFVVGITVLTSYFLYGKTSERIVV
jgi:hypothetical protein